MEATRSSYTVTGGRKAWWCLSNAMRLWVQTTTKTDADVVAGVAAMLAVITPHSMTACYETPY